MRWLVFTGLEHHFRKLRPLLGAAERRGHTIRLLTAQNPYCDHNFDFEIPLKRSGQSYRLLQEYRHCPGYEPRLAANRARHARAWSSALRGGASPPWYGLGIALDSGLQEVCEDEVTFELALEEEAPDAVLALHEGNFWTRPFSSVCATAGVPFYAFQEGSYYDQMPTEVLREYARCSRRSFTWGESDRRRLIAAGCDPERLLVSGPTHLDPVLRDWPARSTARERLGLPPDRPLVLLVTPNGMVAQMPSRFLEALAQLMGQHPEWELACKWRPVESGRHRPATDAFFRKHLQDRYHVLAAEDALLCVAAADCVLSTATSLACEAVALGCPTLEVAWAGEDTSVILDLQKLCGVERIREASDLELVTRYVAQGPPPAVRERAAAFRQDSFAGLDGRAIERVLEHIERDVPRFREERSRPAAT
jgi:glycosyltransferase involved in cell wall biosynthesis